MNYTVAKQTAITEVTITNQSFIWMFVGLLLTGISSLFVASNQVLLAAIYSNNLIFFGLFIAELALVFFLSARIQQMSFGTAVISFAMYSILNGVTLSSIFLVFTASSITTAFFTTAFVFGIMAMYGYITKRDLTSIGNLAFMALIGIVLASIVNLFLRNDIVSFILSCITVLVFISLTAYDTQKIKQLAYTTTNQNLGIYGALTLYLDFINIFLSILQIFGKRRND